MFRSKRAFQLAFTEEKEAKDVTSSEIEIPGHYVTLIVISIVNK